MARVAAFPVGPAAVDAGGGALDAGMPVAVPSRVATNCSARAFRSAVLPPFGRSASRFPCGCGAGTADGAGAGGDIGAGDAALGIGGATGARGAGGAANVSPPVDQTISGAAGAAA